MNAEHDVAIDVVSAMVPSDEPTAGRGHLIRDGAWEQAPMGVLDALDSLASARQSSAASRANPLHLLYYGDPKLTGEKAVELPASERLPLQVIDAMRRALSNTNGLGISAPHVGAPLRICFAPIDKNRRRIMVNPRILKHGRIRSGGQEGSLCVPGFHCFVQRWNWVEVEFFDGDSHPRVRSVARLEGLEARILQHQLDAMDGHILPPGLSRQQRRQCERIGAKARGDG